MLRHIISAASVPTIVATSALLPSVAHAHGTFKECIDEAGRIYAQNIKNGTPRDAAAALFASDIAGCEAEFKAKR
jgi:hypothetical protein